MQRWKKIAGAAAGSLLLAGAAAFASWPWLLEGYARDKVLAVLATRFDGVECGTFDLRRDSLEIADLVLSSPDASVHVDHLTVDFTPLWLERRVAIDLVTVDGGNVTGTIDGFRSLRRDREPERGGPSRVDASAAQLALVEVDLDLSHDGWRGTATAIIEADSPAGPFSVEMADAAAFREDEALASAKRVRTMLRRDDPFPLTVTVAGLSSAYVDNVKIRDVGGTVQLEDAAAERVAFDLAGETAQGQSWTVEGEADRPARTARAHLTAADVRPAQLPLADLPVDPERGTLSVDVEISREGDKVTAGGRAELADIQITHPRLSRDPVVIGAQLEVVAHADVAARELVVSSASLRPRIGDALSTVEVSGNGRLLYAADPDQREYEFTLHMEAQPCQEVLRAMPPGLLPGLRDFELGGETSLDMHAVVKMSDPDATVLEGGLEMEGCTLLKVPEEIERLEGAFRHVVRLKSGGVAQVTLAQGSTMFAAFDEMNPAIPAAVLSSEDGSFWKHKGYRPKAMLDSLRRNVELGTIRRGASTLTMQMVKNVLLSHERTLSRKLQELFLTWVVEKQLSKRRILEIYLNVVEFGPGIYGVAGASEHYFGQKASEINSKEAAFLATLLPNPVERHEMWCRGEMTESHAKKVGRVHARMLATGRITQQAYDEGETEGVVFTRRGWPGEAACLAQGRKEAKGSHVQEAIDGLLSRADLAHGSD